MHRTKVIVPWVIAIFYLIKNSLSIRGKTTWVLGLWAWGWNPCGCCLIKHSAKRLPIRMWKASTGFMNMAALFNQWFQLNYHIKTCHYQIKIVDWSTKYFGSAFVFEHSQRHYKYIGKQLRSWSEGTHNKFWRFFILHPHSFKGIQWQRG